MKSDLEIGSVSIIERIGKKKKNEEINQGLGQKRRRFRCLLSFRARAKPDEEFLERRFIILWAGVTEFMKQYVFYVYLTSSSAGITYVGVTNDLARRVAEHKAGTLPGFSTKEGTHKLVYYEEFQYVEEAIAREKQIKSWRRKKKRALIRSSNPKWKDLSEGWFED